MSIVVLSVALSIHQMSGQRQQLKYEPVKETVLAITSDLKRALTIALRNATHRYYSTLSQSLLPSNMSLSLANIAFNGTLNNWKDTVTVLFSHLNVKNRFVETRLSINWGDYIGWSYAYVVFNLDIDAYGFNGWNSKLTKYVVLTIFPETIRVESGDTTGLIFNLMEDGKPVTNLKTEHLQGYILGDDGMWAPADIESLKYLGKGDYNVTLLHYPRIKPHLGVILKAVTPRDSIIVSARYLSLGEEQVNEEYNWFLLHAGGPYGMKHKPKDVMILPWGLWNPNIEGEYTPQFSHGRNKQWAAIYSPLTPTIDYSIAKYVNITIYAVPVPTKGEKRISVLLYFFNSTHSCTIVESDPIPFPREGWYTFGKLNFTDEFKNTYKCIVPSGSRIVLEVTVDFLEEPYGTFHLQYGGNYPSKIEFIRQSEENINIFQVLAKKVKVGNINYFDITVGIVNTGSVDATITTVLLNNKPPSDYTGHEINVTCDGSSLPFMINKDQTKIIYITITPTTKDPFRSDNTIEIRLRSASGNEYSKSVTLPK
jgi:hypothetical protein